MLAAEEEAVAATVRARESRSAGGASDPASVPGLAIPERVRLGLDEERARVAGTDDRSGSAGRGQTDGLARTVHVDTGVPRGRPEPALDAAPDGRGAAVCGEAVAADDVPRGGLEGAVALAGAAGRF